MDTKEVLSLGSPKTAAMYFEKIIPLNHVGLDVINTAKKMKALGEITPNSALHDAAPVADLLPEKLRRADFMAALREYSEGVLKHHLHSRMDDENRKIWESAFPELTREAYFQELLEQLVQMAEAYGIHHYPIDRKLKSEKSELSDPIIIISNLKFIDAEKLTWKEITEFRKDTASLRKFRRFRTFAYENYSGKSESFVSDDIQERLASYEDTIKKWNFQTVQGALTSLLSSKVIAGSASGSFLAALLGQPITALAAASGGIAIELGRMALDMRKRNYETQALLEASPVSHLTAANELAKNDK